MKVNTPIEVSNVEDFGEFKRYISNVLSQMLSAINGNIDLIDNVSEVLREVVFASIDTDTAVSHSIGKIPRGFIVVKASAAMSVYNGSAASTSDKIFLRSNVAGTASVLIF